MNHITLLHPSRSRPEKAWQTAWKWVTNAGCEIEHILSLDSDEPMMGDYVRLFNNKQIVNTNSCVVQATNHAAKAAKGNILLYLSDDFDCFPNWGTVVLKEFENENRPLLVKVDDCLQKFEVAVLTIPIMNRALYETLGYFWHPGYKSMFVDEHLYWTSRKLGALKMAEHIKFPHNHVSVGKAQDDETYRRSSANWDQGKALFALHKSQGFPI